ncbi:MAG: endonuclease domain-containing protein [Elusimicrobiota bacterium]|jgi:very-short-patch-repair endonuclease|nr:endonuclease domain-containing protein [Elusimicrobiota bacterium]
MLHKPKNRSLVPLSKTNRKNMTDAERKLWYLLRGRRLKYKFRRQQQIGRYILDFVCLEQKLIIECDGGQHTPEKDKTRTDFFTARGYRILRFWNNDILNNIEGVWYTIRQQLDKTNPPSPRPSPIMKGEGEKNGGLSHAGRG